MLYMSVGVFVLSLIHLQIPAVLLVCLAQHFMSLVIVDLSCHRHISPIVGSSHCTAYCTIISQHYSLCLNTNGATLLLCECSQQKQTVIVPVLALVGLSSFFMCTQILMCCLHMI